MSLFESLLKLRHELFVEPDRVYMHGKIYKLLRDYRPENGYYKYETDNLSIMCRRELYSNRYLITNYKLAIIIFTYDYYSGNCFAFHYDSGISEILENGGYYEYRVFMYLHHKKRISDALTFNDFLPKPPKSARSQL